MQLFPFCRARIREMVRIMLAGVAVHALTLENWIQHSDRQSIENLIEWQAERGLTLSPKVEFKQGQFGWSVVATEPISSEEQLIVVDRDSQINLENAVAAIEEIIAPVRDDERTHRKLDCIETLALFLCIESRKAELSVYWPWLRTLPTDFSTLLISWGERYDTLLPWYLRELKRGHVESMDEIFDVIDEFYNARLIKEADRITRKEYDIAYSIITTRYKEDTPEFIRPEWFAEV